MTDKETIEKAKEEVAKENNKSSWFDWGYECSEPYGKSIPPEYFDKAALRALQLQRDELRQKIDYLEKQTYTRDNTEPLNYIHSGQSSAYKKVLQLLKTL